MKLKLNKFRKRTLRNSRRFLFIASFTALIIETFIFYKEVLLCLN